MRRPLCLTLLPLALLGGLLILVGGYYAYAQYTARKALVQALSAVIKGQPLPPDLHLDILGMQVQLQHAERFADVLRSGYSISRSSYSWPSYGSSRAFAFHLDVQPDIGLICEVERGDTWLVFCGQLRCSLKPCVFTTRPQAASGGPNNTLVPTRKGEAPLLAAQRGR